jgi:hypothetical protein
MNMAASSYADFTKRVMKTVTEKNSVEPSSRKTSHVGEVTYSECARVLKSFHERIMSKPKQSFKKGGT